MTFKLRIPGREEMEAPSVANPANPLIEAQTVAANDAAAASRISGFAELAVGETRNAGLGGPEAIVEPDVLADLHARTDAEVAIFEKRLARNAWLGYGDGEDRATRLLHRDREGDDRRLCMECSHAGPAWRCAMRDAFLLDQLQRCPNFKEKT